MASNVTCHQEYPRLDAIVDFLLKYYQLFLIIFGFMGNLLTIIVFWRTKFAHSLRTSYYLICLAMSDILFLVLLSFNYLELAPQRFNITNPEIVFVPDFLNTDTNAWRCKIKQYLSYVITFVSCNLVLTFTAQRLLVIVFPLRFHKITMESKSKYVVMFLILVGCFLYSFVFFTYDIRDGRCSFVNNNNNNTNLTYFPHVDLEIFVHILDSTFTFFIPFFGILIMNAIIIQTLKNSGYNFANRTSNMKRISFKRIDSCGGNNAQQNGHCNRRHSIENQNARGDNNNNNNILNEKNSNECNMCRFHQEHDRDEVSSNKAKSISSVNKNLDGDNESNQHEEKDTTVCFKSPKKKRRNSVEIKLSKKPSKRSKSVLATYKFTNNNTNNINNNLLECEADKAECNNPNNKGFTYKFQKRRTSTDTQFSASSRKNSMRLNRALSIRISGPKAQTVSRKITKMLVIISISFLILNMPLHFFNVYIYLTREKGVNYTCIEQYTIDFFFILHWTSFSCNFLLYSISGVMFRNELKKLIYQVLRINPSN